MDNNNLFHKSVVTMLASRRLILRAIFTAMVFITIVYIIRLLFFYKVEDNYRDILNVIIGALVAQVSKVVDFWFKKDDEDNKEDKEEKKIIGPMNP